MTAIHSVPEVGQLVLLKITIRIVPELLVRGEPQELVFEFPVDDLNNMMHRRVHQAFGDPPSQSSHPLEIVASKDCQCDTHLENCGKCSNA